MKSIITVFILFIGFSIAGQTPREVVQAQLNAYNAKDIDAFMDLFAENAALYRYGSEEPIAEAADALREIYSELFENSPELHSEVINRTVIGNKVIDYELIVGRKGQVKPLQLVMIYEVKDGKIVRATSLRE